MIDREKLALACRGKGLTPRQTAFVLAFLLEGRNGAAAYRAAYSVSGNPHARWVLAEAGKLLAKPHIRAMIREIEDFLEPAVIERAIEVSAITRAKVMLELAKIAFANMEDFTRLTEDGVRVLDLSTVTRDQMAAVRDLTVEETIVGKDGKRTVRKSKLKLHSKVQALKDIGVELGMFQTTSTVNMNVTTPEVADARDASRAKMFALLDQMAKGKLLDLQPEAEPVPAKPNGKDHP